MTVPLTAPGAASISHSGSGNAGTNVTFYRSADASAYSAGAPATHAGPVCAAMYVPAPSTPPSTARVSGSKSMGAYMGWSARSNATHYHFQMDVRYSPSGKFSPLAAPTISYLTRSPNYSVTFAAPYAQVRGRARACNASGCSAWSAWDYEVLP